MRDHIGPCLLGWLSLALSRPFREGRALLCRFLYFLLFFVVACLKSPCDNVMSAWWVDADEKPRRIYVKVGL
uniref:Uncharacterized protein n=1 Tax=Ixodes scapularis TaxID=6945 RepID=A0A4D5RE85_IXOSC